MKQINHVWGLIAAACIVCGHCLAWTVFRRRQPKVAVFSRETDNQSVHKYFMKLALEQAMQAGRRNEVPIGAIVVRNITTNIDVSSHQYFQVLAAGRNEIETKWDASAHAELVALRQAAQQIKNWRLLNCTLYSTLEPCPMCLSACQAFRLSRLVYGAPDLRLGAVETYTRLLDLPHPFHNVSVEEIGVLGQNCSDIMRSFFRERRRQPRTTERKRGLFLRFKDIWSRLLQRWNIS